MSMCVYV